MSEKTRDLLEALGPQSIDLDDDNIVECYAVFIEMALGPGLMEKDIEELTDEERAEMARALSLLSGEIE